MPKARPRAWTYSAKASVGGKLAQVGSRLIDGVARKMADDFFTAFNEKLAGPAAKPAEAAGSATGRSRIHPAWWLPRSCSRPF